MYLLTGCLTVLLVGALVSDVSALPLNNCTARYQTALEEALTIKEQCEEAAFYDCCQVRSTSRVKRHRESKLVPRILIQLQNILSEVKGHTKYTIQYGQYYLQMIDIGLPIYGKN